jgi:hypothetical protein
VEVFAHRGGELGSATLWVKVFVAKGETAMRLLRALEGRPEGAGVAEVEVAGG